MAVRVNFESVQNALETIDTTFRHLREGRTSVKSAGLVFSKMGARAADMLYDSVDHVEKYHLREIVVMFATASARLRAEGFSNEQ